LKFANEGELNQWVCKAQFLWLFLDYDGTLVDFSPSPEQLNPHPELSNLLTRLVRKRSSRITILSGRRLADLQVLLPVKGIFLAGTYGIDVLTPKGQHINRAHENDPRPLLDIVKPLWEQIIAGSKGFILEDKGMALALHARLVEDVEADRVLLEARQAFQKIPGSAHLRILGGDKFLEVLPLFASKRESVHFMVHQFPFPDAQLLYMGDDDKDEEAFSAIHSYGGVAIKVKQPANFLLPSEADYLMNSPSDVVQWLDSLTR
jgi:trehalose 6-phosphate phosphatase